MKKKFSPVFLGAGVALGVAFGAAMHKLGAGIVLGLVFGLAISLALTSARGHPKKPSDKSKT